MQIETGHEYSNVQLVATTTVARERHSFSSHRRSSHDCNTPGCIMLAHPERLATRYFACHRMSRSGSFGTQTTVSNLVMAMVSAIFLAIVPGKQVARSTRNAISDVVLITLDASGERPAGERSLQIVQLLR
ncbi:unnamed protein product [Lasius platythorax]|uniref:Uncharacterized protein n=1 Tax=Lasius platythorax TaxID=488582 RepID=A0AAV2P6H9_9HYME